MKNCKLDMEHNGGSFMALRYCIHCGKEVSDSAAYCINCGKEVDRSEYLSEKDTNKIVTSKPQQTAQQKKMHIGVKIALGIYIFFIALLIISFFTNGFIADISDIFLVLGFLSFFTIFPLLIISIVKTVKKNPKKKVWWLSFVGTFVSMFVFLIIGAITSCNHEYIVISSKSPTCSESGYRILQCTLCDYERTDREDSVQHSFIETSRLEPSCTHSGNTVFTCTLCKFERTEQEEALQHSFTEISRTTSTFDIAGEIITQCIRCELQEVEVLAKLEREPEPPTPVPEPTPAPELPPVPEPTPAPVPEPSPVPTLIEVTIQTTEDYKSYAIAIDYDKLVRTPDDYIGQILKVTISITQVEERGSGFLSRFRVPRYYGWEENDDWLTLTFNQWHITYELPDRAPRIIVGDTVIFYGEFMGLSEHRRAIGGTRVLIPHLNAMFHDLQNP